LEVREARVGVVESGFVGVLRLGLEVHRLQCGKWRVGGERYSARPSWPVERSRRRPSPLEFLERRALWMLQKRGTRIGCGVAGNGRRGRR
jgi:hypothetical protein